MNVLIILQTYAGCFQFIFIVLHWFHTQIKNYSEPLARRVKTFDRPINSSLNHKKNMFFRFEYYRHWRRSFKLATRENTVLVTFSYNPMLCNRPKLGMINELNHIFLAEYWKHPAFEIDDSLVFVSIAKMTILFVTAASRQTFSSRFYLNLVRLKNY